MENLEKTIILPVGWVIDGEESNGNKIVLKKADEPKKKPKRFIDDKDARISGFVIDGIANICPVEYYSYCETNYNIFATEKFAKSALAMARISQIMKYDERFGGIVADEEWADDNTYKYVITRNGNQIITERFCYRYCFLAFHTKEQRDLFLEENEQLVKDFLMID